MSNNLAEDLDKFKSKYYDDNKKNVIFKKSQKMDLANKVCEEFDVNELIQRTFYVIAGTSRIYIEYPLFKVFASPAIYPTIIEHVQRLTMMCIERYGKYDCHLNLDTFTVTAAERYQNLIHMFCDQPADGFDYTSYMTGVHVYNMPSSIDSISKILLKFVDAGVRAKITGYTKKETPEKMALLSIPNV